MRWLGAVSVSTTSGSLFPWRSAITVRECSAISGRAAVLTLQVSHAVVTSNWVTTGEGGHVDEEIFADLN